MGSYEVNTARLIHTQAGAGQSNVMAELITNLHMHTTYSDGSATHQEIARAALQAGLDVVIITDHNILVKGLEGYHQQGEGSAARRVLLLVGEEVHDATRDPQKNHLLVLGAGREMVTFAPKPQNLIDQVHKAGGLCFIAHPYDHGKNQKPYTRVHTKFK